MGVVGVVVTSIAEGLSAHFSREAFSSAAWLFVSLLVIAIPAFLRARERDSVRAGLVIAILLSFALILVGAPISIVIAGVPFYSGPSEELPLVIFLVLSGTLLLGAMIGAVAGILGRLLSAAH